MIWDAPKNDEDGQAMPTKALRRFLGCLAAREAPVLLDLGPVVGPNITFFGERLSCKIIIRDLCADLDRASPASSGSSADTLNLGFGLSPGSVDGVLCWNIFDFLDPASARALARALTSVLRPDGAALGFFATAAAAEARFSKYLIVDESTLMLRPCGAGGRKRTAFMNRDIIRMFEGLEVSESFLLKNSVREFLFRKPSQPVMSDNDVVTAVWDDQLSGY